VTGFELLLWFEQSLWDLDSDMLKGSLSEDMSKWMRMLSDITRARATFDTSMVSKQFGPIVIHFEHVRDKVNHKYDSWHKELLGKFAGMLGSRVRGLRDAMSSWRNQLEAVSFDGVPALEVATPIMKVQEASALLATWEDDCAAFLEGEKLLQRQRHVLPSDWLLVSNLEGEWQSVNQVCTRRREDMNARLTSLRSHVSSADSLLVDAFNKLAAEWERDRYVIGDVASNPPPPRNCVLSLLGAVIHAAVPFAETFNQRMH
jgi:dynein heavy chain 1, cytosolic